MKFNGYFYFSIPKRFGSRDGLDDSSDTMEQLNQMISKFESLSSTSASKKSGNNTTGTYYYGSGSLTFFAILKFY